MLSFDYLLYSRAIQASLSSTITARNLIIVKSGSLSVLGLVLVTKKGDQNFACLAIRYETYIPPTHQYCLHYLNIIFIYLRPIYLMLKAIITVKIHFWPDDDMFLVKKNGMVYEGA